MTRRKRGNMDAEMQVRCAELARCVAEAGSGDLWTELYSLSCTLTELERKVGVVAEMLGLEIP